MVSIGSFNCNAVTLSAVCHMHYIASSWIMESSQILPFPEAAIKIKFRQTVVLWTVVIRVQAFIIFLQEFSKRTLRVTGSTFHLEPVAKARVISANICFGLFLSQKHRNWILASAIRVQFSTEVSFVCWIKGRLLMFIYLIWIIKY